MINFITHSEFYYTRMMLFSWTCDSTPINLSQSNGEYFIKCVNEIFDPNVELIIINCNNINHVDDHFIDPIIEYLKKTSKSIIFFSNDNKAILVRYLGDMEHNSSIKNNNSFSQNDLKVYYIDNHKISSTQLLRLITDALNLEKSWIKKRIHSAYTEFPEPKRLSSTPLLASGEFNATKIISNPSTFKWVVILLAELVNDVIQRDQPKFYTILAASLRGAAIAGAVWELLYYTSNPKLYIIDHMGPRHDLIEKPKNNILLGYCVYVGDFLIGGTEVKIANSFCNLLNGNIKHAFILGQYVKHENLSRDIKLHSLVNLQECVDGLSYSLG